MTRWDSPARGAVAPAQGPAPRAPWRIALVARSIAAAVALAWSTVAGVVAAFAALVPPALRGGPQGRRVTEIGRPRAVVAEAPAAPQTERALPQ